MTIENYRTFVTSTLSIGIALVPNKYLSMILAPKDTPAVREFMKLWWYYQSRYYTCDQLAQTYALFKSKLNITEINEVLYRLGHVCLVSHHKKLA